MFHSTIQYGFSFKGITRFYESKEEAVKMALFCGLTECAVFISTLR